MPCKIKRIAMVILTSALLIGQALPVSAETDDDIVITYEGIVQGLIYLCDSYPLKSEADENAETLAWLPSGHTVEILETLYTETGIWCHVSTMVDEVEYAGYVNRGNLAIASEEYLARELQPFNAHDTNVQAYGSDIEQFPASYQNALWTLKNSHPNWVFVPYNTGLDWEYVIDNEMVGSRSLIGSYRGAAWKGDVYGTNWSYASRSAVKYYMDPRNFLNEVDIFQFEQLTYNDSYHTVEATSNILNNTFMRGIMPGTEDTYAQNFVNIGRSLGVSPFHIASRVAQEQGNGTSPLISGEYPGYEGYYNYFNIGASGSTNEEIYISGLKKARDYGWTSPYLSIHGGASVLTQNYIRKGQDTLYLQKFDVDASYNGLFSHQYMQNIEAPYSEAKRIYNAYNKAGAIDNTFVFKIPVYSGMPSSACASPDVVINSVSIYIASNDGNGIVAGAVVDVSRQVDLEYRWLTYDVRNDIWSEAQAWTRGNEWFSWKPASTGDYLIQLQVRVVGSDERETATIGYNYVSEDEVRIKGMCQMPYEGEGGGYLIGVETNKNPGQSLRYELLILDCTLLAQDKPAWVWSSGQCQVAEGNAFWAVWQPQYGYYWTLFRVFDAGGNMIAEECYGFQNI